MVVLGHKYWSFGLLWHAGSSESPSHSEYAINQPGIQTQEAAFIPDSQTPCEAVDVLLVFLSLAKDSECYLCFSDILYG